MTRVKSSAWAEERRRKDKAEIERLQGMLAQCYRLSGADPDGDEDWRLAEEAVEEVTRMRREFDELKERL